jgi:hypothetical protein
MVVAIPARRSSSLHPIAGEAVAVQFNIDTARTVASRRIFAGDAIGVHRRRTQKSGIQRQHSARLAHQHRIRRLDPQQHEVTSAVDVIVFAVGLAGN